MAKRQSNQAGNLESLFLRLEELVLANSGEDEFEEIFKLVIAKLCDERHHGSRLFRSAENEQTTFNNVATLIKDAERRWPGILGGEGSKLTPEHLEVCVQAFSKHTISDESLEVMDAFFEFLASQSSKGAKGQYFTPRHVVEMCVQMIRPQKHETVADPACGSGGFLVHSFNYVGKRESRADARDFAGSRLFGFDFDARAIRIAKALMVLAGGETVNVFRLNSLLTPVASGLFSGLHEEAEPVLTIEDVSKTTLRKHKGFDVILTNPPFAGEVRERNVLDMYELGRGRASIERDVLFLERCVRLLRPGGRMAMVLPHNKFAMSAWSEARSWLLSVGRVLAVVGLGRHTFLPHTHQKASVLFFRKHSEHSRTDVIDNILFAISERDGKDSTGRPVIRAGVPTTESSWTRLDHDLGEIVTAFDDFYWKESTV